MHIRVFSDETKAKVIDLFMQIDGKLRIVIATMGYSMGVDCPDIYRVSQQSS